MLTDRIVMSLASNMPEGLVPGLWRDKHLERQMAPNGDCEGPGLSP